MKNREHRDFSKRLICSIVLFSVVGERAALATKPNSQISYVVKKGDTLSRIAMCFLGPPVYGKKRGSLEKVLSNNPQLRDPNLILYGQKIILPRKSPVSQRALRCEKKQNSLVRKQRIPEIEEYLVRAPAQEPSAPKQPGRYAVLRFQPELCFVRDDVVTLLEAVLREPSFKKPEHPWSNNKTKRERAKLFIV